MCFRGSKNQQNVPCIQTKDADQEREYKAWAKGRVQSESENETKREIESMWESEIEREIDSVWESESEMIVRLREWEGYWESESDERVRLCGRKGDSKSLSVGVKNRGQKVTIPEFRELRYRTNIVLEPNKLKYESGCFPCYTRAILEFKGLRYHTNTVLRLLKLKY